MVSASLAMAFAHVQCAAIQSQDIPDQACLGPQHGATDIPSILSMNIELSTKVLQSLNDTRALVSKCHHHQSFSTFLSMAKGQTWPEKSPVHPNVQICFPSLLQPHRPVWLGLKPVAQFLSILPKKKKHTKRRPKERKTEEQKGCRKREHVFRRQQIILMTRLWHMLVLLLPRHRSRGVTTFLASFPVVERPVQRYTSSCHDVTRSHRSVSCRVLCHVLCRVESCRPFGQVFTKELEETPFRYLPYLARAKRLLLSSQRYIAYSSDVGESLRPVLKPWQVNLSYGIAGASRRHELNLFHLQHPLEMSSVFAYFWSGVGHYVFMLLLKSQRYGL